MKMLAVVPVLVLALAGPVPGRAQAGGAGESLPERVAALKQSMAQSQQALRSYKWVETTTVSMKGEQKSMKQANCFYGADGKVQKTPIAAPPPPPPKDKRGVRGKVVESKKEEITDTMKQAVALVKTYLPPGPGDDPARRRCQEGDDGNDSAGQGRSPRVQGLRASR